jgi:putative ABC transport system permease protein
MMISSVAWRNVGRNRKRSLIVMMAVLLGTTAGVFTCGLIIGWSNQRIDAAVHVEESHLKLYHPDFLNNEDIDKIVPHQAEVSRFLVNHPQVQCISQRIKLMAMATTSHGTTGLMLNGVDVAKEKQLSTLYTKVLPAAGRYLEPADENTIFISDKTAELLRIKTFVIDAPAMDSLENLGLPENLIVKLVPYADIRFNTKKLFEKEMSKLYTKKEIAKYGPALTQVAIHYRMRSKILFTVTDKNGELVNQTFRVCGIYRTNNALFDQINAFVPEKGLAPITGLAPGEYHEIAVLLKDGFEPEQIQKELLKKFSDISALTWKELVPDAGFMAKYMALYNYIIMGFILFALAFGIVNTMMMAILERTKELGMLMAIGMNKSRVFSMILLETVYLTLAGAVGGMLTGWLVIEITGHTGLDFSAVGEGFEAMGWPAIVYPEITPGYFFGITLLVILAGILSSIAPAKKALSMNPVEALRTDN